MAKYGEVFWAVKNASLAVLLWPHNVDLITLSKDSCKRVFRLDFIISCGF